MKSVVRYFFWLSFANIIFIAGQMLRVRTPILDFLAAWALLGLYLTVVVAALSFLLTALHLFFRKIKFATGIVLMESGLFALVLASWTNVLRMLLLTWGIHPLWFPARALLLAVFISGMVLFPKIQKRLAEPLPQITRNMGVVFVGALLFWFACLALFMRRIPAAPANPEQPVPPLNTEAPNIIYIVLDAMSARDLSVCGYRLKTTPALEQLAQTWTVYENANSAGTGTVANMPAVLTGRYPVLKPWSLYGDLSRCPGWLNLADVLHAHGYRTLFVNGGGMHPNFFHFQSSFDAIVTAGTGWYLKNDPFTWAARLPPAVWDTWVGKNIPLNAILPYPYARNKTELMEPMYAQTEKLMQRPDFKEKNHPFFLYMHMLRPHAPYLANEFEGRFLPLSGGFQTFSSQLHFLNFPQAFTPQEQSSVDRLHLRYDENIRKADAQIGQFIEMLKAQHLYDPSLIIITSDHGTSFSNGYVGYYSPILSASEHAVPLLVKFPHQTQGRRVAGLVSAVDIAPTVLTLLQISYSSQAIQGQPLQSAGKNKERIIYVCNASDPGHSFAALYKNLKIVQRQTGLALFDLKNDPGEAVNLWGQRSSPVLENALRHFSQLIAATEADARRSR